MSASVLRRKRLVLLGAVVILVAAGAALGLLPVRSGQSMVTATYNVPPKMAATFAAQYATRKLGWQIATQDQENDRARLLLPAGQGEVSVVVEPAGRNAEVTLHSHVRYSLFRKPPEPLRDLKAGLDDKLPPATDAFTP